MLNSRVVLFLGMWLVAATLCVLPGQVFAVPAKPAMCAVCMNCHKTELKGAFLGYLDGISFKAQMLQVKLDNSVETLNFDEDTIQVVNEEHKSGDGELLRDNAIKKGHEVRVEYSEKDGVKTVVKLTAKPPVELAKSMLITTPGLEKLVQAGPVKGTYFLFDSRPASRFQEGAIPGAVNLPFTAFDQMAGKLLPKDKSAQLIFYCSGVTCSMSPSSAAMAMKLGYTNIKVYKDGMPAWSQKHYAVLTARAFKEAWLDKDVSHVLLDARAAGSAGFIRGAVSFPVKQVGKRVKSIDLKDKKAPIVVYDAGQDKDAVAVAAELIKAGYGNVKLLAGGLNGWKEAGFAVESGRPTAKMAYVARLTQGEIDPEEFKGFLSKLPENVEIVDVRLPAEVKTGMLKNAKAIPLAELRNRLPELAQDKLIVFQCSTGTQAEIAYNILKESGYTNVKYLNAKVKIEKDGSYSISKD